MAVERAYGGTGLVDVLDRILDKGLVIDVWARVNIVGIELLSVEARVVVASVDTYLKYASAIGLTSTVARPTESGQDAMGPGAGGQGAAGLPAGAGQALPAGQGNEAVADQLRNLLQQLQPAQGEPAARVGPGTSS